MISIGDFTIESDATCFTVKRTRASKGIGRMKTDKMQIDTIGYFGKFSQVIQCIANQIILDGTESDEVADITLKLKEMNDILKGWKGDLVYVLGEIKKMEG
jgi:hypothetical protein